MPESLFVQTETLSINGSASNKITLVNAGPGPLAYKHAEDVSLSDYDGTLTPDSSTVLNRKTWFVSTNEGCRVFAIDEVTYSTDMATQKELEDATFEAGGPPSGPAGGVLAGTYPDPNFAEDMVTQTELNTVTAAGVKPAGAAGGVLAGSYPNPAFSQNMATQAELDAAVLNAANAGGPAGGVLSGTYPNPAFAADMATQAELNAAVSGITGGEITVSADTTGVTDATTAMNTAYAAVVAQGGGTLRIPPGTYKISGAGLNMNANSMVRVIGYGATFNIQASGVGITVNPGTEGDGGLGGTIKGIKFNSAGTTQTGIKVRNANRYHFSDLHFYNGSIAIWLSNETGGYNEDHLFDHIHFSSPNIGIKFDCHAVASAGDPSFEECEFVHVNGSALNRGIEMGTDASMQNVSFFGLKLWAVTGAARTCVYSNCDMKGLTAFVQCEALSGSGHVIWELGAAAVNQQEGHITLNYIPDPGPTGAGAGWATGNARFPKAVTLPLNYKFGGRSFQAGALGGYIDRYRRSDDTTDRMRSQPGLIEWGPGGSTAPDAGFGYLGTASVGSNTSKITGFGLDAHDQKITNVAPGVAADDAATVSQLGTGGGGGDTSGSVGVAIHGSDASFARPTGYGSIEWIGTVEPSNAEDGDTFVDTNAVGLFNANNYGADPTGATDSTAAIADAIAAIPAEGGVLYFPAGTYLITPASPALELGAGITVLGDGRSNTFLKCIDSPSATSGVRFFDITGGRVEFRNICFSGATTPGTTTKNVIGIRHNNVAGIHTYMQNCGSERMNMLLTSYDGASQTIEVVDCYFDGSGIGSAAGEAQESSTCIQAIHIGGGMIARNTTFTGWGSNTATGSNFDHVLYLREETALNLEGCRFLNHYDGRYVQVNGTVAGAGAGVAPAFWAIRNCYFGTPTIGNDLIHTNPLRRSLVVGCEFAASTNYGHHIPAAILPKGDCLITDCLFRGGASSHYTINCLTASKTTAVKNCVFYGTSAYDIKLDANSASLFLQGCEFYGSATVAHVFQYSGKTFITIYATNNTFFTAAGASAISTDTSGSIIQLVLVGNYIAGGAYGLRVQAGATVYVIHMRANQFGTVTSTVVSKAGTVVQELSKGNIGYYTNLFDITDYGAVGDNTTNCTTAIQNALNAAATAKGSVFVPKGTFICNNVIQIGSDTELYGQGFSSVIKAKNAFSDGHLLRNVASTSGNDNIYIHDICLDGNRANITGDPLGAGPPDAVLFIRAVNGQDNVVLRNVWEINSKRLGIVIHNTTRLTIAGCHVFGNGRDGITLTDNETVTVVGNEVRECNDDHIGLQNSRNVTCTGNTIYGQGDLARGKGICVRGGEGITITGNNMYATSGEGIVVKTGVSSGGTLELDASRVVISGNCIFDTAAGGTASEGTGIMLHCDDATHTVKNVNVVGNYIASTALNGIGITNPSGSLGSLERIKVSANHLSAITERGIYISDNVRHLNITANYIDGCDDVGIYSIGTHNTDLTVLSNEVNGNTGATGDGIRLTGWTDGMVANNYAHDNSQIGIVITGAGNWGQNNNVAQGNAGGDYVIAVPAVASASTIAVPRVPLVSLTGSTDVNTITVGGTGQVVTLVLAATAKLKNDVANLNLSADGPITANDTITLICDGATWFETSRSIN